MPYRGPAPTVRRVIAAPGSRAGVWLRVLLAAVVLSTLFPVAPSSAFVKDVPITIDGSFGDWIPVRADPENVVVDSQLPDDPDYPGQPDRDVYLVASTYDSQYLYLSWRRTAGGTKAISFGAYLDYDGDGLLESGDKVLIYTVSTGGPYASYQNGSAKILDYHPSGLHAGGDPMRDIHRTGSPTGDGETPDGYVSGETAPSLPFEAYLSPAGDGIECEARVAWSDLGVEAGYPFAIHFAAGNGSAWGVKDKPSVTYKDIGGGKYVEENRGQIEDNIEPIMYLRNRGVTLTPNNISGSAPLTSVTYYHTLTNTGNASATYDLSLSSGWTATLLRAPTVTLASHESTTVAITVDVPDADGQQNVATLIATMQGWPGVSATATDTTRCGTITVTPNQTATMAPGQTVEYSFTVQNNGSSGWFDLTTTGTQAGWTRDIFDDAGNPITGPVPIDGGDSLIVKVRVTVPAGTANGVQDVTRLTATMAMTTLTSSATGTTTVADGLVIAPDLQGYAGANTYAQYTHTITNSWPTARTVALSYASSQGWTVTFYGSDGILPITSIVVGPNGAAETIIVRVSVPSGVTQGTVDTSVLTARASGSPDDTATDVTTVRRLTTYADGGYVNASTSFYKGDKVYARATGLKPGSNVSFVWRNENRDVVRTSSTRQVDTQGMAFDDYTTLESDPIGPHWSVELMSGGTVLETQWFEVRYKARITALSATDAPNLGQNIAVSSAVINRNTADITNSTMAYLIWWDNDGNGLLSTGDTYITDAGAPATYSGTWPATPTHTTAIPLVAGSDGTWTEPTPWTISNAQFPNQGTYQVTAVWRDSAGIEIDRKTSQFYSIPTLGWPLFILTTLGAAFMLWRRRPQAGGEAA